MKKKTIITRASTDADNNDVDDRNNQSDGSSEAGAGDGDGGSGINRDPQKQSQAYPRAVDTAEPMEVDDDGNGAYDGDKSYQNNSGESQQDGFNDDEDVGDDDDGEIVSGESVLHMAIEEKSNAMHRGKSAEFDRVFAPRPPSRSDENDGHEDEKTDDSRQVIHTSVPGAFRVSNRINATIQGMVGLSSIDGVGVGDRVLVDHIDLSSPDGDDSVETRVQGAPSGDFTSDGIIFVQRATLVTDMEAQHAASKPPLVEAVEKVNGDVIATSSADAQVMVSKLKRRARNFRLAIFVVLVVIAAVLIGILVQLFHSNDDGNSDSYEGPPPNSIFFPPADALEGQKENYFNESGRNRTQIASGRNGTQNL